MKRSAPVYKIAHVSSLLVAIIFVLLPLHAFLTVWLASAVGHYTILRLWKETLLIIASLGAAYILIKDRSLREKFISSWLVRLVLLYGALTVGFGLVYFYLDRVTQKALGYGLIVDLRFLIILLTVWIIATKSQLLNKKWSKLVLWPAVIVVTFGLLQKLALPYDVLKHFGYNDSTIYPYETINHNINFPRIMSTLRGANPLGAYMVLILSLLAVLIFRAKNKIKYSFVGLAGLLVIIFSYSRSAWLGLLLSLAFLGGTYLKINFSNRKVESLLFLIAILCIVAGFMLRNNSTFQNLIFHTEKNSSVKVSSNDDHISAFKNGINDVVHEPLGEGVGTAGPASIYNNRPRISENYYLQVGQELGWIGMIMFIAVNILVALQLWARRDQNLAIALLASLIGITFINLVSHAWTDDTLSLLWWGLAGVSLANLPNNKNHSKD